MARTTVTLEKLVPALYKRRDFTGDWTKFLSVIEATINDLLSSPDTRASLYVGLTIVALEEGAAATAVRVEGVGGGFAASYSFSQKLLTLTGFDGQAINDAAAAINALPGIPVRAVPLAPGVFAPNLSGMVFAPRNLKGGSPAGYVLGKISIDAMTDLRDPLRAEARLLAYLGQHFGWDLDTSGPVALQRKTLQLLHQLLRLKGTKPGIVAALRLLLGLEVEYWDLWGDAWTLGVDALGTGTVLGPAEHAPAWSRGTIDLTGLSPGLLADNNFFFGPWGMTFEIQTTAPAGSSVAYGWFRCPTKERLANGLRFTVRDSGNDPYSFALKVDAGFTTVVGHTTVDLSATVTESDVATVLGAALAGATGFAVVVVGDLIRFESNFSGVNGNHPMTGSALPYLDAVGMQGGAGAGGFVAAIGGSKIVNLIGATSGEQIAAILRHTIAFNEAPVVAERFNSTIALRSTTKGEGNDGPIIATISPAASPFFIVDGMTGGNGVSRALLTFQIKFPRHLNAAELRAARGVLDEMKRNDTHYVLVNPPDPDYPAWQLGVTRLGQCYLGRRYRKRPVGVWATDPYGAFSGGTRVYALDDAASVRTLRLVPGGRYVLTVDDDCWVRQGNRVAAATNASFLLPAYRDFPVTTSSGLDCFVAALRCAPGVAAWMRITRVDGGASPLVTIRG